MMQMPTEAGDYEVMSGYDRDGNPEAHRFENVTFSYGQGEELQVLRGGLLIATFRWWDSIKLIDPA